jgi:hypothetical protein
MELPESLKKMANKDCRCIHQDTDAQGYFRAMPTFSNPEYDILHQYFDHDTGIDTIGNPVIYGAAQFGSKAWVIGMLYPDCSFLPL